MQHARIQIACECGMKYYLPSVRADDKIRLDRVLDFARCPYCMEWRSPEKAEKYKDSVKCFDCNVPQEIQPILKKGRCQNCYYRFHSRFILIYRETTITFN